MFGWTELLFNRLAELNAHCSLWVSCINRFEWYRSYFSDFSFPSLFFQGGRNSVELFCLFPLFLLWLLSILFQGSFIFLYIISVNFISAFRILLTIIWLQLGIEPYFIGFDWVVVSLIFTEFLLTFMIIQAVNEFLFWWFRVHQYFLTNNYFKMPIFVSLFSLFQPSCSFSHIFVLIQSHNHISIWSSLYFRWYIWYFGV